MQKLTEYTSYADAQRHFSTARLWDLFDGTRERLNIASECIDRHASPDRVALRVAHADGHDETITFIDLAMWSARFAHWLTAQGVQAGDRVAIMLEPSLAFYAALFGAMKHGAIAVPLFTLFGADGVRLRTQDCTPAVLVTNPEKAALLVDLHGPRVVAADAAFMATLKLFPDQYKPATAATDMAIFQYTSGTTREMPDAIKHTHRAVVVVMNAALYGTGLRPADRFFCPSSPAWGHGLWHGTLAPLALGIETGAYAGKFDAERLPRGLSSAWALASEDNLADLAFAVLFFEPVAVGSEPSIHSGFGSPCSMLIAICLPASIDYPLGLCCVACSPCHPSADRAHALHPDLWRYLHRRKNRHLGQKRLQPAPHVIARRTRTKGHGEGGCRARSG